MPNTLTSPICVLLIDDHALFRKGLSLVLGQLTHLNWDIQEAPDVQHALEMLQHGLKPQLILLDIYLPGVTGLRGLSLLRRACPSCHIAMMSSLSERPAVMQALDLGADGFISKTDEAHTIQRIVGNLLRGHRYFAGYDESSLRSSAHEGTARQNLTPRQQEVLGLMALGSANKVIARKLGLSENTVRVHVAAVMEYLGCYTRTEATHIARQRGLLQ